MRLISYLNENINEFNYIELIKQNCKPYLKQILKIGYGYSLFRGFKSIDNFLFLNPLKDRKPSLSNNKISEILNKSFDKLFNTKLRSETVFASGNFSQSSIYGKNYLFFPINNFNVYWSSEVKDLYTDLDSIITKCVFHRNINVNIFGLFCAYYDNNYRTFSRTILNNYEYISKKYNLNLEKIKKEINSLDINTFKKQKYIVDKILNKIENDDEILNDTANKFLSTIYNKNNLLDAIKSENEIMVDCKSYYLIDTQYIDELNKNLF